MYKIIDRVTPVHRRDIQVIIQNREKCFQYISIESMIVLSDISIKDEIERYSNMKCVNENSLYPELNYSKIRELLEKRGANPGYAGWYYQQFLKMAYCFYCENEYYLLWDADLIPLRTIEFFEEDKPMFTIKREKHEPYFRTIDTLFNGEMGREIDGSFIAEHMLIKSDYMKALIKEIEDNQQIEGKYFYEKIMNGIQLADLNELGFSEYETYGNYVQKRFPDSYKLRKLKTCRHAFILLGGNPIEKKLDWVSKSYDIIALETKEYKSILSNLLTCNWVRRKYSFREIVHWYKKYVYKTEYAMIVFRQKRIDRFWILAKKVAEKMRIYDKLREMKR